MGKQFGSRVPGLLPTLTLAAALMPVAGHPVERSEVPERLRWDLRDLYADEAAWLADKSALAAELPKVAAWRGRLGESAQVFAQAIAQQEAATQRANRLYAYALQLYDQDARVARSMQMKQEAQQALTDLQTATSYMRPEILALGRTTIDRYLAAEPALAPYRMYLDDILRAAPHTLSESEERILAGAATLAESGETVRSVFTSAELP